jgi:hypothetical protein
MPLPTPYLHGGDDVFAYAIGNRVRSGADGFMPQVATKIIAKSGDRSVAFLRFFLKALAAIVSRSPRRWRQSLSVVTPRLSAGAVSFADATACDVRGASVSVIDFTRSAGECGPGPVGSCPVRSTKSSTPSA